MPDWVEKALLLCREVKQMPLAEEAEAFISQASPERPLLVACSGGADSLYLLLRLYGSVEQPQEALRVLHFDHQVRGEASAADAAFVAEVAEGLGIGAVCGTPKEPLKADEAAMREARYGWFAHHYHAFQASALCLGHHADDLLETQLMNLVSGSGPGGLSSPRPVARFPDGQVRLRPLLNLSHRTIAQALEGAGIPWREDATNFDHSSLRSRLRSTVMPSLEQSMGRSLGTGALRSRKLMQEAVSALDWILEQQGQNRAGEAAKGMDIRWLTGLPEAAVRRAVMGWWFRHQGAWELSPGVLDELVRLIPLAQTLNRDQVFSIGQGKTLRLTREGLHLKAESPGPPVGWKGALDWYWPGSVACLPDGSELRGEEVALASGTSPYRQADPVREAWLDLSETLLHLRSWRPGDRYRQIGAPGSKKVQDLFTDIKVPLSERHLLPIVCDGRGTILWIPGFAPAEAASVKDSGKTALKLTYRRV